MIKDTIKRKKRKVILLLLLLHHSYLDWTAGRQIQFVKYFSDVKQGEIRLEDVE